MTSIPTPASNFDVFCLEDHEGREHLALRTKRCPLIPLVRIHSECLTGDVFSSLRCDCGLQLQHAIARIGEVGGLIIYLRQEGRGIGLRAKLAAYDLQDHEGLDTVVANTHLGLPADARTYEAAITLLRRFGVTRLRLITNNPAKIAALELAGIDVVEQVPSVVRPNSYNAAYLRTKKEKMGHLL